MIATTGAGCGCDESEPRGLTVVLRTSDDSELAIGDYRLEIDADGVRQTVEFRRDAQSIYCTSNCPPIYVPFYRDVYMIFELTLDPRLPVFRVFFDNVGAGPGFVELRLFLDGALLAEGVFLPDYATSHNATDLCSDIRSVDAQMILPAS